MPFLLLPKTGFYPMVCPASRFVTDALIPGRGCGIVLEKGGMGMKLRRFLCLMLLGLMLTGCAGRRVKTNDLAGCWYMGSDGTYRYFSRFEESGTMEILQISAETGEVAFRLTGSYTLEKGTLLRTYATAVPEDAALAQPAELTLKEGSLILDYGELRESWSLLSGQAWALCCSAGPRVECPDCAGLGTHGLRDELPLWCRTCCGLGVLPEDTPGS